MNQYFKIWPTFMMKNNPIIHSQIKWNVNVKNLNVWGFIVSVFKINKFVVNNVIVPIVWINRIMIKFENTLLKKQYISTH